MARSAGTQSGAGARPTPRIILVPHLDAGALLVDGDLFVGRGATPAETEARIRAAILEARKIHT